MKADQVVSRALERIRLRWYVPRPRTFWRDRRQLLEALTWPAAQMKERGVPMRVAQYASMLDALITGIEQHGDARVAGEYFPAYLKRCVCNHWQHHWEEYYNVGKTLRGTIDRLVARAGVRAGAEEDDAAAILAAAHALVAPKGRQKDRSDQSDPTDRSDLDPSQLDLFG